MSAGSNYVENKFQYEDGTELHSAVSARVTNTTNTIPSGASIVRGIYYMWNDEGFTGKGWMHEITGGPTNIYPDFKSNNDVAQYVIDRGNLDAVFSYWAQSYTLEGWDNFYNAVGVGSGCMDVDHSQT